MTHKKWQKEKLSDIKNYPEKHKHSFKKLQSCCINNKVIDMRVMDAHIEYADLGTNKAKQCNPFLSVKHSTK